MNISILYRPNSEHERLVLDYQRDFKQRSARDIELVSLDTVEGDELAKIYGVDVYPTIIVRDDEGVLQHMWQGDTLPLMDEVLAYAIA